MNSFQAGHEYNSPEGAQGLWTKPTTHLMMEKPRRFCHQPSAAKPPQPLTGCRYLLRVQDIALKTPPQKRDGAFRMRTVSADSKPQKLRTA